MLLFYSVTNDFFCCRRRKRSSRKHRVGYVSLDDTSTSSDYPVVGGKSVRRMINSENAVQIAKRYLRKHSKSLKVGNIIMVEISLL